MAYELLMSAFKIGDPIETFIYVKIDDFPRSSGHLCVQWFHV